MRHSLWVRLLTVFLGIIVVGVVVMVVSLRFSAATNFSRRVLSNDVAQAQALAPLLSHYYSQNQNWEGIMAFLATTPQAQNNPPWSGMMDRWMPNGMMGRGMMGNWSDWFQAARTVGPTDNRVVVLDATGRVVADTGKASTGEQHPFAHLQNGVAITLDDKTVGTVLVGSMIEPVLNPADEDFLNSVNWSILVTSLTVGLLVLIFGSLLFWQITSPLRALTQASEAIASGKLNQRVQVRSEDEIGRLARAFNRMAESLSQADTQRRNLLADIAHELRTPLTVIQGNLEGLLDGVFDLTPENVATVHRQTMVLNRLVADLRDLALAEAGQLQLERKPIDLKTVIAEICKSLEGQASEKGITLILNQIEPLPSLDADEQRITQVLFNLLTNAMRYTPTGGTITISAEVRDRAVVISVRDTGVGIASEELPHVFDRFYRANHSRTRRASTDGSGLGLTISRQIVEAHGGQIWAQSSLGVGSTFAFSLPLSA
jgi:signal transduction histidine kinase